MGGSPAAAFYFIFFPYLELVSRIRAVQEVFMSKVFRRWLHWHIYAGFLFAWCLAGNLWAQSSPIVFNTNGGWCWYQDERAIINNNKLIIGSVADASGTGGGTRDGNVEVTTYDLSTSSLSRFVLKRQAKFRRSRRSRVHGAAGRQDFGRVLQAWRRQPRALPHLDKPGRHEQLGSGTNL